MTTTRLTDENERKAVELTAIVSEIRRLNQRAEELKWQILDSREHGAQKRVSNAYGVDRQVVNNWVKRRRDRAARHTD